MKLTIYKHSEINRTVGEAKATLYASGRLQFSVAAELLMGLKCGLFLVFATDENNVLYAWTLADNDGSGFRITGSHPYVSVKKLMDHLGLRAGDEYSSICFTISKVEGPKGEIFKLNRLETQRHSIKNPAG